VRNGRVALVDVLFHEVGDRPLAGGAEEQGEIGALSGLGAPAAASSLPVTVR